MLLSPLAAVITHYISRTDYELACCYELPLFFEYPPEPPRETLVPPPLIPDIAPYLSSPLYPSLITFQKTRNLLGLTPEAADILDDIRFLTLSIIAPRSTTKTAKIQSTASWLHTRINSLPTAAHPASSKALDCAHIATVIQHSALIYTASISTPMPFTLASRTSLISLALIKSHIRQVDMTRWKEIPGIFLWVLLILCPSCGEGVEDRRLQKKMAVTGMAIGLEGFGLGIEHLKAFWAVQRWIAEETERRDVEKIQKEGMAGGDGH
jgi:hypothetical protein